MLIEHEKFVIADTIGSGKHFFIEVNWQNDDPRTNECKVLKITFPNNDVIYMKKEHLMGMLFAIGNPAEQRQMTPQVIRRSRWYETIISVKAKKNIKQGQNITFPLKISLPTVEEEVIAEMKKDMSHDLIVAKNTL